MPHTHAHTVPVLPSPQAAARLPRALGTAGVGGPAAATFFLAAAAAVRPPLPSQTVASPALRATCSTFRPSPAAAFSAAAAEMRVGTSEARSARESLERAPPALLRSLTDDFERKVCAAKARACAGAEADGERRASEAWCWRRERDFEEVE